MQRALPLDGSRHRVRGITERAVARVADGLEDGAVVLLDDAAQQRVVRGKRLAHRVRSALPQLRAALDVGEQKRHDPGRKSCVHGVRAILPRPLAFL